MGTIVKKRKHSVFVLLTAVAAVVFMLFVLVYTQSDVKAQQEELAALEAELSSLCEENAQYDYILNEADAVEQYEYQARELGYGYPDETKVIDVTPGN